MNIVINNRIIYADGYILIPEEKAVQFYKEKSDLDYMPPIKVDANILSDFGVEIITRGNCMMCGKELTEGLFFCKECEEIIETERRNKK